MALPDYYARNAQAAASLIQGFDATALAARLENEVVGIIVDKSVLDSPEAQHAVDLTVRMLARLYPTLAIVAGAGVSKAFVSSLGKLASAINPKIDLVSAPDAVTKMLVFGATPFKGKSKAQGFTWYVGSDNWVLKLSRKAPVGSGKTANPLGAGAAACVATANVFRAVFAAELGGGKLDDEVSFSLLTMRPFGGGESPALGTVHLDDVHLVGAGAIGNGVLWALSRMQCTGQLHVVDHEKVTDSNLQRYVMLEAANRDAEKAALAKSWFPVRKDVTVEGHVSKWADHVATVPDYKVDTVLSAVDTAKARIEIQSSLPRTIFNAWTQLSVAGVSRHQFLGNMACLACLYLPKKAAPMNEDELVVRALKLPVDKPVIEDVRRRLQKNEPTDRAFLERVAAAAGVEIEKLLPFENRPLRDLYVEGVCGGRVMEFHQAALQANAEVPMAFQSALAGILLAAELARPNWLPHAMTQFDLLDTFPEQPGTTRLKTQSPACLCLDADFIDVYRAKYGFKAAQAQAA
ncbi:MAG TPA: E2 ligase fold family C protein [Ramlibacter sp.]|uniref:E2 ligase fold family C protein n=1 Tax=Ramlibacter sp. TaxID=1917967 RepID=UPI002ED02FC2